jgi:transcriptional regulator with XRE-family HTH domain
MVAAYRRRARPRLSQEKLAERLGWAQKRVSMVENGQVAVTLEHVNRIALALGVLPWDLLTPVFPTRNAAELDAWVKAVMGDARLLQWVSVTLTDTAALPDVQHILGALADLPAEHVRQVRHVVEAAAYRYQQRDPETGLEPEPRLTLPSFRFQRADDAPVADTESES